MSFDVTAPLRHIVPGYHGTSQANATAILNESLFKPSDNGWLGEGVYFWEGERSRAALWRGQINARKVISAQVNLTSSPQSPVLDLTTSEGRAHYKRFVEGLLSDEAERRAYEQWYQRSKPDALEDAYFLNTLGQTFAAAGHPLGALRAFVMHGAHGHTNRTRHVGFDVDGPTPNTRVVENIDIILCVRDTTRIQEISEVSS